MNILNKQLISMAFVVATLSAASASDMGEGVSGIKRGRHTTITPAAAAAASSGEVRTRSGRVVRSHRELGFDYPPSGRARIAAGSAAVVPPLPLSAAVAAAYPPAAGGAGVRDVRSIAIKVELGESIKDLEGTIEEIIAQIERQQGEVTGLDFLGNDISKNFAGFNNILSSLPNITHLYLHNTNIGELSVDDTVTLFNSISLCRGLRGLNLSDNNLAGKDDPDETTTIENAVDGALGTLTNLEVLYLGGNIWECGSCFPLPSIGELSKLRYLSLRDTRLSEDGSEEVTELAAVLERLTNLEVLDLRYNYIGSGCEEEGEIKSLADALSHLTKLKRLYLSKNDITTGFDSMMYLLETLGKLESLDYVDLGDIRLLFKHDQAIELSKILTELALSGIVCEYN